jgi:STE24 endopeptidase
VEPLYTATQLAEVQAYHAPIYTSALVDLVVWPLVLFGAARFLTRPLFALATRWGQRINIPALTRVWNGADWAASVIFAVLFFGFFALVTLPIDVWFGFVREHEFGLSTESFGSFLFDGLKNQAILVVSVSALAFGLFGLARRTKHWWWMVAIATSLALVVSTAIDPYRSRLYVDQTSLPEGSLRKRLSALLNGASIPFSDIYVVHTGAKSVRVQAAFAGTGPTRSILLSDTLLDTMTEQEVVAAVAHEAGHVSESRWPGRILSPLAVFALMAFVEWLFRRSTQRGWFGITTRGDVRVLPLLVLTFDLATTLVTPVSAGLSRGRELAADRFGVKLSGDGDSMVSLLVKLGRINKIDPDPPRWYVLSGVSHPTILQRVAAIRDAQKNATPPPMSPVNAGTSEQQAPGVIR